MRKNILKAFAVFLPIIIIGAVYSITPSEIVVPENARYSAYPNGFVRLDKAVDTSALGKSEVKAELFGAFPIKTVEVSVVPTEYVEVSGEVVGIRIYADGVMVTGVELVGPARAGGIKQGDIIKKINGQTAQSTEQLSQILAKQKVNRLTVSRGNSELVLTIRGREDKGRYTVGMWIRDSAAGIGTLTYIETDGSYGALGHAICDADTEMAVPLLKGTLSSCKVSSVKQGKSGEPGELVGTIGSEVTGTVEVNSELGIYGKTDTADKNIIPVATRFLVKEGSAQILCNVDGDGIKSYEVNIDRVSQTKKASNKSMTLTVTDPELLSKTGGIVQGMSGSPIIQNGKLVGAVTHVFVNDPTRGYAIFIENMLDEELKVK